MNPQIEALLEEANKAKAWLSKISTDLKYDPTNENLLRLKDICRQELEIRRRKLAELGVSWGASKYPDIDD
jgi:hypothetical protein